MADGSGGGASSYATASAVSSVPSAASSVPAAADALPAAAPAAVPLADFRSLVERADRKFARARDLPPYGRGPHLVHYHRKAFKAYTRVWRLQQECRGELVAGGLQRWEIGEVASRIGQLYYIQYLRTSEAKFLLEAYVFYEAILIRGYFEAGRGSASAAAMDLSLRYKELRFLARFLVVALLLSRREAVRQLADRLRTLVEESKVAFPETNFKEWKQVLQEIMRFLKADKAYPNTRPLRYSMKFDSHPSSIPYVRRFHAKRVLRLQDAVLTSYHRNEVKFTDLTLDTFRMLQCLEWEPSGSFYQIPTKESNANGAFSDHNGASGLIDINLAVDMMDSSLPSNPRKAIIYHPSVSHLIAVIATICEELSSECILLLYISASGKVDQNIPLQNDIADSSLNFVKLNLASQTSWKRDSSLTQPPCEKSDTRSHTGNYLWLGSRGNGGLNNLYPEDLIPFTRRPLFLIVDSDNSDAFKVIHGAERGEAAALLLSPSRPSLMSRGDTTPNGSQFTFFLTAPLKAFCQLVGLPAEIETDVYSNAESILFSALTEWEVMLCTSDDLEQVWAQILPDHLLRRLILRFIFCRAVFSLACPPEEARQHLPDCLPGLPSCVSSNSATTQLHVLRLAEELGVVSQFHFPDSIRESSHSTQS